MAAYASLTRAQRDRARSRNPVYLESLYRESSPANSERVLNQTDLSVESGFVVELVNQFAERVAAAAVARLGAEAEQPPDEWLDSRHAALYLGVHRDTLRRLAAERRSHLSRMDRGAGFTFAGQRSTTGDAVAGDQTARIVGLMPRLSLIRDVDVRVLDQEMRLYRVCRESSDPAQLDSFRSHYELQRPPRGPEARAAVIHMAVSMFETGGTLLGSD